MPVLIHNVLVIALLYNTCRLLSNEKRIIKLIIIKKVLIDRLSINAPLEEPIILQLLAAYRTAITHNLIGLLEGRLVYYEPVPTVTNHICRIIVPLSLRCTIFTLVHVTPVSERMGEYKILYRIKLNLFWPRLRSDDTEWI